MKKQNSKQKKSEESNLSFKDKLDLKCTVPYLFTVILLKEAFSLCTMIEVFEFIFIVSTSTVFILLPYISLVKK